MDNLQLSHARRIEVRIADDRDRIELFCPQAYTPEYNRGECS
jgi:hypothetical protein